MWKNTAGVLAQTSTPRTQLPCNVVQKTGHPRNVMKPPPWGVMTAGAHLDESGQVGTAGGAQLLHRYLLDAAAHSLVHLCVEGNALV